MVHAGRSGTLTAAAEAWFVATRLRTPPRHALGAGFWIAGLFWAALWVGMTVSGGSVTAWAAGLLVRAGKQDRVWKAAAAGWALLPCLMVMALRGSWWTLPVAALAAGAAVFRLRPLFHTLGEERRQEANGTSALRSLDGLPPMGAPPLRSFLVAASAQLCVVLAVKGAMGGASVALAACVMVWIAGWTAWDGRWARQWIGDRAAWRVCGLAVVLLMLVLARWMGIGGSGMETASAGATAGGATPRGPQAKQGGSDYVGIVLWPPPKKKVDIVPPRPNEPLLGRGAGSKPLVIPFDGPYWYFKAPMTGPGPKAHVMFGKSTEAKVRSTNWMPLRMEAHQNLGLPIDLDCCREIDVTVTNADVGAGRIDVSLVLTDTDSPGRRAVLLGDQPVISSQGAPGKTPVTETLKFAIPRTSSGLTRRFNEIDVVIQPPVERARSGARSAVEEFELVPR